jgi:FKBP-type peptidyl-prolyl cis-trans isomerase FklB
MRLLCVAVVAVALVAGQAVAAEKVGIKSEKGKRSYSIGYDIGTNISKSFKQQSMDVDPRLFSNGVRDAFLGKKPALSEQEIKDTIAALQKELMAKRMTMIKELSEKNKKEGASFLAGNKKKAGVTTLPDGLQYRVIKQGAGESPTATSRVKVNYKGRLINGTEFDSSYKRGTPAEFDADKVIKGWTEILPLMKEGSTFEVVIPSELAYGERGQGAHIGPNATLIFEIELISVVKK